MMRFLWVVVAALAAGCGLTVHRSLSLEELNRSVAQHIPVERRQSVFFVRLAHPEVTFPGGNRLEVQIDLEAGALVPPPEWQSRARDLTETALLVILAEEPVYTLDADRNARERAHLRRVWVEADELMLEISL